MRSPEGSRPGMTILAVCLVLGVVVPAAAQTPASPTPDGGVKWSLYDAVGYGALGFGLGLAATWDMEGSGFGPPGAAVAIVGATTAAGIVAGAVIGNRAQRAVAEGRRVDGAHRAAVIGGVVLAGGTLGALAAVPLINSEGEGTALGSDEQTFALLALAGGALGSLYAWKHSDELSSRSIGVAPAVSESAGYGLRLRMSF